MSDYQRFITYINLYENDEKQRNVGFAKIEKRKEQCRFEIHMKNIGYTGQNSQIYFYVRQEQELECILVGSVQIINGMADRRILLNGDNIAGSGRKLEEISGLVIFINEQVMLASQWKTGEMLRRLFRLPGVSQNTSEQAKISTPENTLEQPKPGTPQNTQEQPKSSAPQNTSGQVGYSAPHNAPGQPSFSASQNTSRQPNSSTSDNTPEPPKSPAPQNDQRQPQPAPPHNAPEPPASLHVAEAAAAIPMERPWSATWQMMLESYPVMTPFEGEEDICCIRIELKELRLLPRRYWYLGNNSFLLHGFFNYRYLVLGQMEERGIKRWFLGVPGVFQNQEKVMAAIFGFPEFKAEKKARPKTNQFGYWYRFMDE